MCPDTLCRPVIGNIVAYADKSHMTNTFMETLAPFVKEDLMALLKQIKEKQKKGVAHDS
ncbi:hypothetical protein [Macrococcus animalis]|uniref:hypothetical protein n=1 Tax=Macrococcus animalis TaxID=3395467 RepID=UPI0039BDE7B5